MTDLFLGNTIVSREPFHLSADDRRRHVYLVGQTGTGKSNTLLDMARQDIQTGEGLAFIDPHGEAAEHLLGFISKKRTQHVVYLNPQDTERPVGFNPLSTVPPARRAAVADDIVSAFRHSFSDSWGPRLEHFLLNACRTILDQPSGDLLGIPLLFLNAKFRERALAYVSDPLTRLFWEEEYPSYSERILVEAHAPIFNKVSRILSSPAVRNVLCQPKSTIDLRSMMDEGCILIINASKGALGEGNAHFLGALIVSSLAQTALSRGENRRPFHLYVDEFQNFATDSFGLILSEARKYGLTLTLAHQYLAQLPEGLRQAVFGNCGSFLSFRVGAEDAPIIGKHIGLENPRELQDLRNFRAIGRFLIGGEPRDAVRLAMNKLPEATPSNAGRVVSWSRNRKASERRVVEARIVRFLGKRETKKKRGGW